ncbi:MAG: hypothetical protein JWM27_1573 [Gemmatimonadetes bacterium]|nr:hypothetical protein [Gemmatimonadota bacterium]
MHIRLLPFQMGKACPRCARRTERMPFPVVLALLKALARGHLTRRECVGCGWQGYALHRDKGRRPNREIPQIVR